MKKQKLHGVLTPSDDGDAAPGQSLIEGVEHLVLGGVGLARAVANTCNGNISQGASRKGVAVSEIVKQEKGVRCILLINDAYEVAAGYGVPLGSGGFLGDGDERLRWSDAKHFVGQEGSIHAAEESHKLRWKTTTGSSTSSRRVGLFVLALFADLVGGGRGGSEGGGDELRHGHSDRHGECEYHGWHGETH